jgi:3-deoxy-D-manno-octulosonate 8-phosphate phosphatase (KDO 8-P phosphatase)
MDKSKIKLLVLDVDGTLTDGKIYMSASGELMKVFDIKDGYGIHELLPKAGITPVIITGRESMILERRCEELGIEHIYQGIANKIEKLDDVLRMFDVTYKNVAYIGDDLNDLPCMERVGIVGCPSDASQCVLAIADYISAKGGGNGAVRDFIEWLIDNR